MMRIKIAMACLLIGAQPAVACHRFSKWYYPFPQRCSTTTKVAYAEAPPARNTLLDVTPPIKPIETIVVTTPLLKDESMSIPALDDWEIIEHEAATMKLRLIQQGEWKDK